jgi:D-alanyl-D-alanine carboxypeptidase
MAAHAWEYGFVMSYPAGKTKKTCYGYEPWHYRYVGRDEAAAIHASGLVLREWLWLKQPQVIS